MKKNWIYIILILSLISIVVLGFFACKYRTGYLEYKNLKEQEVKIYEEEQHKAEEIEKEKEKNEEELERKIIESTEHKHVDAFLCSNNIIAFQVLQALKKLGKQVPTEIGVVTFDNYPFAEYMDPPLTVVDIDTYKLGEMAAEVLINKIKDQNFIQRENLISTELIPRLSTRKV